MQNVATNPNPFGFGDQVFGQVAPEEPAEADEGSESDAGSATSEASEESISVALASTLLSESPWLASPSYPPLYLASELEHLPPPKKTKLPPGVQVVDPAEDGAEKDANWSLETYENSIEMDNVFDRFAKRVGHEPEQCIRSADFGGAVKILAQLSKRFLSGILITACPYRFLPTASFKNCSRHLRHPFFR